jgi:hypothetical protein
VYGALFHLEGEIIDRRQAAEIFVQPRNLEISLIRHPPSLAKMPEEPSP